MRLLDFFVFYLTELYINTRADTPCWDTAVRRTVSAVGIMIGLWALSVAQIIFFLLFNRDFWELTLTVPIFIVAGIAVIQLLRYVYIVKKRYKFIQGAAYRISRNAAIAICTTVVFFSVLLPFGVGIIILKLAR